MPEAWTTLTADSLGLNSAEDTAYRTSLLKPGETDRLPQILEDVTYLVRSAIRSHRSNRLDPDPDTLPRSAVFYAASIARYRLMSNFPGGISEARRKEYDDAQAWLRQVQKGEFLIEGPGEADDTPAPPKARPSISKPNLTQRREDASGS
jgi:phage gp36-like protein